MNILYQILISCFVFAYLPLFFFQLWTKGKYKGKIKEKLGLKIYPFDVEKQTIWIHAVSVGEIKAVSSLLKDIKDAFPDYQLIVSSITETGHAEAKKCTPFVDHHILMPVDFKGVMRDLLMGLKLKLVILVETDIWPNFLSECKKKGAGVVLVNGKVSERSFKRLEKIPSFANWYFSPFNLLLVQDKVYKQRFIDLGVSPEKLSIVPNLKLDDVYPELSKKEEEALKEKLGIDNQCVTIGSTHDGEEEGILKALTPLLNENKALKVLFVPRHPERIHEVEKLLERLNLNFAKLSDANAKNNSIILVDRMGFLRTCYQISDVAVVAGSFTPKVGGHNILEPLWYSTPTVFGPYMQTQSQFLHLVNQAQAGSQVPIESLEKTLQELLKNTTKRAEMGQRGRAIFDQASGGSKLAFTFLKKVLVNNSKDVVD